MANYVSPGVYTIEKDISEYSPSINTSIVGVVGFASKGPTNKATLITSQGNLIKTFGTPSESITGQGLEGALEILEQTNSLYYIRAADSTAAYASAVLPLGSCPAVIVSGVSTAANGLGVGFPVTLRIQVYNNNGVAQFTQNSGAGKDFVIPANTGTYQAAALRKIVGGALDSDLVGVFAESDENPVTPTGAALSGVIVGGFAGSGAYLAVTACSSTTYDTTKFAPILKIINPVSSLNSDYGVSGAFASSVFAYGSTYKSTGTNSIGYVVESLYPGAGYNGGTTTAGNASGNSISVEPLGSKNFTLQVLEEGSPLESFKVSFVGSGNFIESVINTGRTNTTSDVIEGNIYQNGSDVTPTALTGFFDGLNSLVSTAAVGTTSVQSTFRSNISTTGAVANATQTVNTLGGRFLKLVQTTENRLSGGTNGDSNVETTIIGTTTGGAKTGMQALDDNELNLGVALVPGIHNQAVQNELITLAERTQSFIALLSPPYAVGGVQDAIDWTNGKASTTSNSRTSAINSSYAAVYWPWVKVFSVFDGIDRWYDPAIFAARQFAYSDSVAESWIAPAGFRRGRLTKPTDVEVKLNQGDRDSLYSGGNVVNPIVSFPQQGITIFGQRTAQRSPSALDRINVRRLMIYIRKIILASTQRFIFEPNDEFTWSQVEAAVNPIMDDIRRRRGISEFRVICDETTNTPVRIDRNEMWTRVLVKPTKTAEVIIFEINLTNQSAQLGTL